MKTPEPFSAFSGCLYCSDPVENFEPGPRGGSCQNMTCRACGARYNLVIIFGQAVRFVGDDGAQPIGRPGQPLFLEVLRGPGGGPV
jgi:hypothetical protein